MDNASYLSSKEFDSNVERVMPFYMEFHRQTLELIREMDYREPVWMDTGCGTGMLVERALELFPDAEFVLADPSEAMAGVCRSRFEGNSRIKEIRICGSEAINEESAYDIITAIQCHHHLARDVRKDVISRCYKALKPGGILVVFEITSPDTEKGLEIAMKRWRTYQLGNGRTDDEIGPHLARYGINYYPITASEQLQIMNESGFVTRELFWRSHLVAGFYAIK